MLSASGGDGASSGALDVSDPRTKKAVKKSQQSLVSLPGLGNDNSRTNLLKHDEEDELDFGGLESVPDAQLRTKPERTRTLDEEEQYRQAHKGRSPVRGAQPAKPPNGRKGGKGRGKGGAADARSPLDELLPDRPESRDFGDQRKGTRTRAQDAQNTQDSTQRQKEQKIEMTEIASQKRREAPHAGKLSDARGGQHPEGRRWRRGGYSKADLTELDRFANRPRDTLGGHMSMTDVTSALGPDAVRTLCQDSHVLNELKKMNRKAKDNVEDAGGGAYEPEDAIQKETEGSQQYEMQEYNPAAKDQSENKAIFRSNYGYEQELPAVYVLDAKIFPIAPAFMVNVVKYVIPEEGLKIRTYPVGGLEPTECTMKELHHEPIYQKDSLVLQLMKREKNALQVVHEIPIRKAERVTIQFSPNGRYFALFRVKKNHLQLYKLGPDNNIRALMDDINEDKCLMEVKDSKAVKQTPHLYFDRENRFLACYGKELINVIPLTADQEHNPTPRMSTKGINRKLFSHIVDIQFVSSDERQYRCDVACKQKGRNAVVIYEMNGDASVEDSESEAESAGADRRDIDLAKAISYTSNDVSKLKVKISEDFKVACLTNKTENYTLTRDGRGFNQRTIPSLKNKEIGLIYTHKSDFFFICYKEYDKDLDVQSTITDEFKVKILKRIEPGVLSVYDVVQDGFGEDGFGKEMIILNTRGEQFYYDVISPSEHVQAAREAKRLEALNAEGHNQKQSLTPRLQLPSNRASRSDLPQTANKLKRDESGATALNAKQAATSAGIKDSLVYSPFRGYRAGWPYVSFSGFQNYLWLLCSFDTVIKRIELPDRAKGYMIVDTYLTSDKNLYVFVMSSKREEYQLWRIDLDCPKGFRDYDEQEFELEQCCTYSFSDVKNQPLDDIYVRSESRKDDYNANKKLFAFFLHRGTLYSWCKGQKGLEKVSETEQTLNLTPTGPEEFIIRADAEVEPANHLAIRKIKVLFSSYNITTLYEEKQHTTDRIKAWAFDYKTMILALMIKVPKLKAKKTVLFKIIDTANNKVVISVQVGDPEIKGRFQSGLFTLVDGHFYFQNKVFKIRYDLLQQDKGRDLNEFQVFDKYENLLDVKHGEFVQSLTPILNPASHRITYFTRNFIDQRAKRIIVLPYLHERRVYLNQIGLNEQYFYTVVQECVADDPTGGPSHSERSLIMAINLTRHEYQIYTERGILINRVDFTEYVDRFGIPIQVSSDGRNFIFQHPDDPFQVHLICFNWEEPVYIKTIQVTKAISQYVEKVIQSSRKDAATSQQARQLQSALQGEFASYFIAKNVQLDFAINNNLDIVVQISSKMEIDLFHQLYEAFSQEDVQILTEIAKLKLQRQGHLPASVGPARKTETAASIRTIDSQIERLYKQLTEDSLKVLGRQTPQFRRQLENTLNRLKGSIFYVQKGSIGLKGLPLGAKERSFIEVDAEAEDVDQEHMFFTRDYLRFFDMGRDTGKFTMNSDHIIFWSVQQVFYFTLEDTKGQVLMKMQLVNMKVDPENKETFIRKVRAGSDPDLIAICVRQSVQEDAIICWDLDAQLETNSFDVGQNCRIFFDAEGGVYATEKDNVILCEQCVSVKSFDVSKVNLAGNDQLYFQYYKGHRLDHKNHNWILFNEYICLSFSFMTLVIRDKAQTSELSHLDENYLFDQEQFNFIINRRTCFTCDEFVGNNYEKLQYVLKQLEAIDPVLLEQLNYYYLCVDERKTPSASMGQDPSDNNSASVSALPQKKQASIAPARSGQADSKFGASEGGTSTARLSTSAAHSLLIEQKKRMNKSLKKVTPLHLAFKEGNNRSINILLKFMAKIPNNASDNIKDILPKMIEFQQFIPYMDGMLFQTIQMLNKQTLKVDGHHSDKLVAVESSGTSFVDDSYYKEVMSEDRNNEEYSNYPVKVHAMKLDWVINDPDGLRFLKAMLKSENLEIYECPTIIIIVEYLYGHYCKYILWYRFPPYVGQLAVFYTTILFHEGGREGNKLYEQLGLYLGVVNLFSTLYTVCMTYLLVKHTGLTIFRGYQTWFDLAYIALNSCINVGILAEDVVGRDTLRVTASILAITIIVKMLYFMQLIDAIAPLVKIIFLILIDIGWFLLIFIIIMFGFATSFYLLGLSQRDLEPDVDPPPYAAGYGDALWHVYLLALGEFDLEAYEIGGSAYMTGILMVYFAMASFLLLIHLLNMLIAIMGETFAANHEIRHQQQVKSHLQFVIENQWIDPIKGKDKIRFLVAAMLSEEEHEEQEVLNEMSERLEEMASQQQESSRQILGQLRRVRAQLDNFAQGQD